MYKRISNIRSREEGLTLIELLIVIVILGVLSAIVILSVGAFNDSGEEEACETDVKTIQTAVEAFYADQDPNAYPANVDALVPTYLKETPDTAVTITNGNVVAAAGEPCAPAAP